MTDRERLLKILNVPIHPHENVEPVEAVADYLLDNGVAIPVRCKDCKIRCRITGKLMCCGLTGIQTDDNDYCSYGERENNGKEKRFPC